MKLFLAKQRICVRVMLLSRVVDEPYDFKKYIPTVENLALLIDEFKYKPMGFVTEEILLTFFENIKKY